MAAEREAVLLVQDVPLLTISPTASNADCGAVVPTPTRLFVASTYNVLVSTVRFPPIVWLPATASVPEPRKL
jgi:hypothetical protein